MLNIKLFYWLILGFLLVLFGIYFLLVQVIIGCIINEFWELFFYVNVYIQQFQMGIVSDDEGMYSFNFDVEGEYNLVFLSFGYESVFEWVLLVGDIVWVNIQLKIVVLELEEIVVLVSQCDFVFGIIKKVIEYKDWQLKVVDSYWMKVYLKVVEEMECMVIEVKELVVEVDVLVFNVDLFVVEVNVDKELLNGLNLVEMEVMFNYCYFCSYKEECMVYQVYGNIAGFFIFIFVEIDFNFYCNLVYLLGIVDVLVIFFFSNNVIFFYKYELVGSCYVNG